MTELPDDLLRFLQQSGQLMYDIETSDVGPVRLKALAELSRSVLKVPSAGHPSVDDPYQPLAGRYRMDVVDLVADCENYEPQGLLCWIPAVGNYGTVDCEHGTILVFPDATWSDIVADPSRYLDQKWSAEREHSLDLLAWTAFPFQLEDEDIVLPPYGEQCPVHKRSLLKDERVKPELFAVLQARFADDWLQAYRERFPCSGVPLDERRLHYCPDCFAAETAWLESHIEAMGIKEATPRISDGWIKCPECGTRFSTRAPRSFQNGVHLSCGQRIRLREPEENPQDYR